jgi:hypothetical protein
MESLRLRQTSFIPSTVYSNTIAFASKIRQYSSLVSCGSMTVVLISSRHDHSVDHESLSTLTPFSTVSAVGTCRSMGVVRKELSRCWQQSTVDTPQAAGSRQQTADSRQQTADTRQQTADSRQQTADSRQQTADST